ncbi:MAG: hypothetical protein IJY46_10575, partial [Lentisphaeria bacterium]|nr:hypothetical protein [Lentisphaeria bacterium]
MQVFSAKNRLLELIFSENSTAVPSEMTCGGASRAILGANLRTQLQSRYYERHKRSLIFSAKKQKSGLPLDKNG